MQTKSKPGAVAPKRKKGDISSRQSEVTGPWEIFLDSGNRDEDGELIMEEFENSLGETDHRPERDTESFLEEVFFFKNYLNPANEEKEQVILKNVEEGKTLHKAATQCEMYVSSWDLCNNGVPIKPTAEDIIKNNVDADILYSVIGRFNEINRPPKALREKLRNISSQKASTEDTTENTE
jgi:hypothetical protein